MSILSIVLLVFFVIIAVLLILFVLLQNEEGDSLGGLFAGGSGSAFGSRSGNVLTKTTSILGVLFFIVSFSLALLNRTPGGKGVEKAGMEEAVTAQDSGWVDQVLGTEKAGENPDKTGETDGHIHSEDDGHNH